MTPTLDVSAVRSRFPALSRIEKGHPAAYLDGPGGTQVPRSVVTAMSETLESGVSNLGGGFGSSDDAARVTEEARHAMSRFFNSAPGEVVFGQNMTSLTFSMSRALARTWDPGESIVLTSLDHDANFTPWVMAARDSGVDVRVAEFDPVTGELEPAAVIDLIDDSTRLVAVCLASNSLGSVFDPAAVAGAAHDVGALVYVDAVHAAPHRLIDVTTLDCDFLVASAYKFFGPHTGVLYGKERHLRHLPAYKVRPAPEDPPGKWETGTQSFESLAGVAAAVEYLGSLGDGEGRAGLQSAFSSIADHEAMLGRRFATAISDVSHVAVHGIPEMNQKRVATFAVSVEGMPSADVAARLIDKGVLVWSGHYYAVNVMDRLGVLDDGGLVRIGFCHYNTTDEVDRALEVLAGLG